MGLVGIRGNTESCETPLIALSKEKSYAGNIYVGLMILSNTRTLKRRLKGLRASTEARPANTAHGEERAEKVLLLYLRYVCLLSTDNT